MAKATPIAQQYSQGDYVDAIRSSILKGIIKWAQADDPNGYAYIQGLIAQAVKAQIDPAKLVNQVTKSDVAAKYQAFLNPPIPPGEGYPVPGLPSEQISPPEETWPPAPPTGAGDDIRDVLIDFLRSNDLPDSLIAFINDALADGMSATEIIARLRETPEYLAAYPENAMRKDAGFSWIPEAQIRAMRDEVNRLTETYFNIRLTPNEIASIIARDKSLSEWEGQLRDYATFQRWGPTVQSVLEQELGYRIPDERAFALISSEIPTPELDAAYERALMRGQPAILGIGIRPEDEAEILRRYGIAPEQAFRGYQGIVAELPRADRLAAIEAEINRNASQFPTGTELFANTPFATLFRAVQLGDPQAIATLQASMAREVARFQGGGAPVGGGAGLLSPEERRTL